MLGKCKCRIQKGSDYKSKKFLRRQNIELKSTAKKSNSTAVVIGLIAALAVAALVYFLS